MKRFEQIDTFTLFLTGWAFGLACGIALVESFWLIAEL